MKRTNPRSKARRRARLVAKRERHKVSRGPRHGLFYLSFATDAGFLGACVVEARTVAHAARRCHELGINPGGEVLGAPIPNELRSKWLPFLNKRVGKAELDAAFDDMVRLGDVKESLDIPPDASVCEHNNGPVQS
jgi:hypothetical protein